MSATRCENDGRGLRFSVLITSRDEGEFLERTVADVLRASAGTSLEIIVVDDGSMDGSGGFVSAHQSAGAPIRLYRNDEPCGLIRSRAFAAEVARGDYICVLDAHCCVPRGWLETLATSLEEIDDRGIVVPALVGLDPSTWSVRSAETPITGCTITTPHLDFYWEATRTVENLPSTCTIGGGAWMARRAWYEHLGGLDREMRYWGGENIDLPLRTWLAGGRCLVCEEVVVGHYFQLPGERRKPPPSGFPLTYNKLRAAHNIFSRPTFLRMLPNLRSLAGFDEAMSAIEREREALGWRKAYFESIRERSDEWLLSTFELPVLEPPFFHVRPRRRRHGEHEVTRPHPRVAVVLVASREDGAWRELARSILETSTYSRFELLVALSGRALEGWRGLEELQELEGQTRPIGWVSSRPALSKEAGDAHGGLLFDLAARQSDAEWLVFIDERAVLLDEHWIEEFVLLFDRHRQLLLVGPRLQSVAHRNALSDDAAPAVCGSSWDWPTPGCVAPRRASDSLERPFQCFAVPSECFAVHRERFLELGGFDRTVLGAVPPIVDLAVHGWLVGYEVLAHPRLDVGLLSGSEVTACLDAEDPWTHYAQAILAEKYFTNNARRRRLLEQSPHARDLIARNRFFLERRRREFSRHARFNDDWLFYKFSVED